MPVFISIRARKLFFEHKQLAFFGIIQLSSSIPIYLPTGKQRFLTQLSSHSSRYPRSAMPPRRLSSAIVTATTTSPVWCRLIRTKPKPWWTLSRLWAGITFPHWPLRAIMARAAWMPLCRFPVRLVRGPFPARVVEGSAKPVRAHL